MSIPIAQAVVLQLRGVLGESSGEPFFNHVPTDVLAKFELKTIKTLVANTSNQQIDLAALFPGVTSLKAIAIKELDGVTGLSWGPNSTGTRLGLPSNGGVILQTSGSPGSLYFNNGHLSSTSRVEICIWGD